MHPFFEGTENFGQKLNCSLTNPINQLYLDIADRCGENAGFEYWQKRIEFEIEGYATFECMNDFGFDIIDILDNGFSECNNQLLCNGHSYVANTSNCIDLEGNVFDAEIYGNPLECDDSSISGNSFKKVLDRCGDEYEIEYFNEFLEGLFSAVYDFDCIDMEGTTDRTICNNKLLCQPDSFYQSKTPYCIYN